MVKIDKNDILLRYSIWEVHGKRNYYNGDFIKLSELEIDHIIPQSIEKETEKYKSLLESIGEDYNKFEINGLENYVITDRYHNNKKKNKELNSSVIGLAINYAKEKSKAVLDFRNKLELKISQDRSLYEFMSIVKTEHEVEEIFNYITKESKYYDISEILVEDGIDKNYEYSRERIKLIAKLPSINDPNGNCILTFKNISLRGMTIKLESKDILNYLFRGVKTDLIHGLRAFTKNKDSNTYEILLGNCKFNLEKFEVHELCLIIDHFFEKYINSLIELERYWATENFLPHSLKKGYKLIKIKRSLWREILEFTKLHDYENGTSDWHIFDQNNYRIQICTVTPTHQLDVGYHSFIHPCSEDEDELLTLSSPEDFIWLTWKPEDRIETPKDIRKINPKMIWNCEITYNWIIEFLLPKVVYELELRNKIIKKETYYNDFLKNFNLLEWASIDLRERINLNIIYDIESLRLFCDTLQRHFYHSGDDILLTINEMEDIWNINLKLLESCYGTEYWSYYMGNLQFNSNTSLIEFKNSISEKLASFQTGVVSRFKIDLLLRNISHCLTYGNLILSSIEVIEIFEKLKVLINIYNNEVLLKTYSAMNW